MMPKTFVGHSVVSQSHRLGTSVLHNCNTFKTKKFTLVPHGYCQKRLKESVHLLFFC